MTCETVRAAIQAGDESGWSSGVLAHVAACDDCATFAVERSLQRAPEPVIPQTFAVDVARRARLEAPPEVPRVNRVTMGIGAAGLAAALAADWFGVSDSSAAVLPLAALLLVSGEAIVFAAWTLNTDVTRARWRR